MTTPDLPLSNEEVAESPVIDEPIAMARATSLIEVEDPVAEENAPT
jgi:hypothetical protein